MAPGEQVVHLAMPWTMGLGTIMGVNEIGWIEVQWANGDVGAYPAQHLEQADKWERDQVERATRRIPPLTA